jgi:diguanylate cyclase (GGDEF)-like protein/PAS domain S-box-containing protein
MQPSTEFSIHLLSRDPEAKAVLLALQRPMHLVIHACDSAEKTRSDLRIQRPDVLVVDTDIGIGVAVETIRHVRDVLFNDWIPIVVLEGSPGVRDVIEQQVPWAVDFHLLKPVTESALRERQVVLRRMVALRRISRSALDRVSEAVIVIDATGMIRSFNGAAEGLFGWSSHEAIGSDVSILMSPEHGDRHPEYLKAYRRTGQPKIIGIGRVETAIRRDGTRFPMHLTVADISDGSSARFVGVIRDLSVYQQRDQLQDLIHIDSLTGLPNRAHAGKVLAAAAKDPEAPNYSVLFCDVDCFKKINDQHGRRVGDEILKAVAKRLRNSVSAGDFVSRLAGDEFLIVLHGVGDVLEAREIARRITEAVSVPVRVGNLRLGCSVSIGAAAALAHQPPQAVIDAADQQMYEIKRARHAALSRTT